MEIKSEVRFIESKGTFDQEAFSALQFHTVWKILYYLSYLLHKQNNSEKKDRAGKIHSANIRYA